MGALSLQRKQGEKAGCLRISFLANIGICSSVLAFLALNDACWSFGSRILSTLLSTSIWQIVAASVVLAGTLVYIKVFPLSWHFRFLRAFIYQVYVQPESLPSDALFRPFITTTRNWPAECDFNMHKSNSTYFADMDIARAHLISCLLKNWLRGTGRLPNSSTAAAPNTLKLDGSKKITIALGAVSCHFRREIPPFTKYEIWTRVLCWDKKWIYVVCHFVKCGAVARHRASARALHADGSNFSRKERVDSAQIDPLSSAIYATGITRYVFKEGRISVPPELFLSACGLLPPRQVSPETKLVDLQWSRIDEEKERGLKYMDAFSILDESHETLDECTRKDALGHFGEF